jgi:hypothetical protein
MPLYDDKLMLMEPPKFVDKDSDVWLRGVLCPVHMAEPCFWRVADKHGAILGYVNKGTGPVDVDEHRVNLIQGSDFMSVTYPWRFGAYFRGMNLKGADTIASNSPGCMPSGVMLAYANILEEEGEHWTELLASRSYQEIQDMNFGQVRSLCSAHGIHRKYQERYLYLKEIHVVVEGMKMKSKIVELFCSECEEGTSVECIDLSGNKLATVPLHPSTATAQALKCALRDALSRDASANGAFSIILPDGRVLNEVDNAEPVRQVLGLDNAAAVLQGDTSAPVQASPPEAARPPPALPPTTAPVAVPAAIPPSQDLQTLMSIGFERSKAEAALRAKGSLDCAIESLLTSAPTS